MSIKILGIVIFAHEDKLTNSEYAENLMSMPLLVVETIVKKQSKTLKTTLRLLAQGELKFRILMD